MISHMFHVKREMCTQGALASPGCSLEQVQASERSIHSMEYIDIEVTT